jgi:hypothetical protein
LRIVQEFLDFRRKFALHLHRGRGEFAIVLEAAGHGAGARVLHRAGQKLHPVDRDLQGHLAGQRHFARVADQAEAGDIGAAVDLVTQHFLASRAIQREHGNNRRGHIRLLRDAALQGGSDHAGADAFGEDQRVAGARPGVGLDAQGVNGPGHGVAEFDLVIRHAVAAEDGAAGLVHLLRSAFEDFFQVPRILLGRPGQNGERGDGATAHGIDVAQRVGRGDGAVGVRVVHNRRKEIHGLHQGKLRRQLVHAGIVGSVKPYQHIVIGPTGHAS